jgi:hypothetical protein
LHHALRTADDDVVLVSTESCTLRHLAYTVASPKLRAFASGRGCPVCLRSRNPQPMASCMYCLPAVPSLQQPQLLLTIFEL